MTECLDGENVVEPPHTLSQEETPASTMSFRPQAWRVVSQRARADHEFVWGRKKKRDKIKATEGTDILEGFFRIQELINSR